MAVNISDERFDAAPLGSLITWGIIEQWPDGVNMYGLNNLQNYHEAMLLWWMWKGRGTDDWCIYVLRFENDLGFLSWPMKEYITRQLENVHSVGDKVLSHSQISKMVNVSERLYDKYRR